MILYKIINKTEEKDGEEDDILNTKGIYSVGLF